MRRSVLDLSSGYYVTSVRISAIQVSDRPGRRGQCGQRLGLSPAEGRDHGSTQSQRTVTDAAGHGSRAGEAT
jgi:hypothetical protein